MVAWLEPVRHLSPFFQYTGHDPLRTGLSPTAVTVTLVSIVILDAAAVWAFRRRDVGT
jgi:ABC-2 type transport system permease protein